MLVCVYTLIVYFMEITIHHTNFQSSAALDRFINEKSEQLIHVNSKIIQAEYHLSAIKKEFKCTLILRIKGKDIHAHRTTDDMHYSILKVIDAAKKSLRKKKTLALSSRQKKTPIHKI